MEKFFVTLHNSGQDKYYIYPYVMISAGCLWNNKTQKLRFSYKRPATCEEFFLDSGGFNLLSRYKTYPFSVKTYCRLAKKMKPDYVAIMDYPCESIIGRKWGLSVEERIKLTVENATECMKYDVGALWIPVIQGYTLDEYKYCVDLYDEKDLLREYMAVGSMCRRTRTSLIGEYLYEIYHYLEKHKNIKKPKIHAFGLKINTLNNFIVFKHIYSTDSCAFCFRKNTTTEKIESFHNFIKKIEKIMEKQKRKTILQF